MVPHIIGNNLNDIINIGQCDFSNNLNIKIHFRLSVGFAHEYIYGIYSHEQKLKLGKDYPGNGGCLK